MITRQDVESTYERIAPFIRVTPVIEVDGADFGLPNVALLLKLEQLQHTGSFKARGAFANLLLRDVPAAGVAAASGGNHGVAVAYAAQRRGVSAKIFIPSVASPAKMQRIRDYGADLVVSGDRYADALAASEEWIAQSGAMGVHAFNQRETLLGQATTALELSRQAGPIDTLLVAPAGGIAADSLAPRRVGEIMFPIAQRWANRVVLVTDDAIRDAQNVLWDRLRIVAEPGGAAAFASLLSRRYVPRDGERIAVLICGGNTTAVDFTR